MFSILTPSRAACLEWIIILTALKNGINLVQPFSWASADKIHQLPLNSIFQQ
jgi:hypothetical protein